MIVKYFAWIKDITSKDSEPINIAEIKDIDELKIYLVKIYPELKKHFDKNLLRIAVNNEYCYENTKFNSNDEIALFPPVSGG